MIDCVIFTKDRACQLDALLRSINDNFKELTNITIIFKASNPNFLKGYKILHRKFPKYRWVVENNLISDIKNVVSGFSQTYCMMFVDDEMVIRDQPIIKPLSLLAQKPQIHCLSLRMGTNVNYTYTASMESPPPPFTKYSHDDTVLHQWEWGKLNGNADWGYPSCVNSHLYRTSFFKPLIVNMTYKTVNAMEGAFNGNRPKFPPHMICFTEPKTISVANNVVQNNKSRNSNKPEFTPESLNKKFLDGNVIDIKQFYNLKINMATFDKDYTFIKE